MWQQFQLFGRCIIYKNILTKKTGYWSLPSFRARARSPWTQTLRAPHLSVGMTWWWNSLAPDGNTGPDGFSSPDILLGIFASSSLLILLLLFRSQNPQIYKKSLFPFRTLVDLFLGCGHAKTLQTILLSSARKSVCSVHRTNERKRPKHGGRTPLRVEKQEK